MGDSRRFQLMAELISRNLSKNLTLVDVASGKGYLQAALRQKGFTNVISFDKRPKNAKNRQGYRYGYFNYETAPKFDAVVAMHPDEATDHCILYAAKNKVPAIICPCCTKPDATPYFGDYNYSSWLKHLRKLALSKGLSVQETCLKMQGKNVVMILRPY